jgi:hypothetical protein
MGRLRVVESLTHALAALLLVHPVVPGSGRRLFPEGLLVSLELADSLTTTTGVVIGTSRPIAWES